MSSENDLPDGIELSTQMGNPNFEEKELASYKILSFRSFAPDCYKSFVFSRWLHSLRFGNDMFKLIRSDTYYSAYSKHIESILKRPGSRLRVAVLSDDEDTALGWSVDETGVLHYVYVKPEVRNLGIATALVPDGIKTISHITHTGLSIWNKKIPNVSFNPFF